MAKRASEIAASGKNRAGDNSGVVEQSQFLQALDVQALSFPFFFVFYFTMYCKINKHIY